MVQLVKIAHSPDTDDAFMFYALKEGHVRDSGFRFEIERKDIEELNRLALDEVYDVTAISMHAYAYLSDRYYLTASGASMAEGDHGPLIVAREKCSLNDLAGQLVAVPGEWTTACLLLKLMVPDVKIRPIRFDQITDAVLQNQVKAGVLIHEGQMVYETLGLQAVARVNDYWKDIAGDLPLPLGGNAVKKSLGLEVARQLSELQRQSIVWACEHPEPAREYARSFKRDLTPEQADLYLSWYANDRTLDIGDEGRQALEILFQTAYDQGLLQQKVNLEIL